jgi:hypothetical protein
MPVADRGADADSDAPELDLGNPSPRAVAPPPGTAAPAAPLSTLLGVQSSRKFLLQHLLVGPRHSYRVLDPEGRHLFTVGENVRAEREAWWESYARPGDTRPHGIVVTFGGTTHPRMSYWVVDDFAGNVRGTLALAVRGGTATATLADAAGSPLLVVHVTRGMASITAVAVSPDGRQRLEARGNLFQYTFSIQDALGTEVARVHQALASVRDTYHLDLLGSIDPVDPLVFAILIDHYKGK